MAVKMRLQRMGRRHRPFFRINVMDSRKAQDGVIIENLGHYDPIAKDPEKQIVLNHERAKYWLDNGAVTTETMDSILQRQGLESKHAKKRAKRREVAKNMAHAKGRAFGVTEKVVAEKKAQTEAKAAEEAEKKAAEEAKAAREAEKKAEEQAVAEDESAEEPTEEKAEEPAPAAEEQKPEADEQAPEEKAGESSEDPSEEQKPE